MAAPRRRLFPILTASVLLALPSVVGAFERDRSIPSATTMGAIGVRESVFGIMHRQAVLDARRPAGFRDEEEEIEQPDRSGLPQNPDSPNAPVMVNGTARMTPARGATPAAPQSVGVNFLGATLAGIHPTFAYPPDGMGAVGPSQFVVFVNGRLVTYDKTTGVADGVLNVTPDLFFGPVEFGSTTSDPRIRYDRLSGRWILVIITVSTPNRVLIAVSDAASGGTITNSTVFTFFYIPIDTTQPPISQFCLADYPTLGVDANALYIGTNNFCGNPSQTFNSCDAYVVQKTSVLGAGPIQITVFRGVVANLSANGPFTPQGVDNYDPNANEGYFIGSDNAVFGRLQLRRIADPGGTPSISANIPISVSATRDPIKVPYLGNAIGTPGRLDALDDRLFAAHIRNGRLWTAHNIQVNSIGQSSTTGGRNGIRWYELNGIRSTDNAGIPIVVQSGTVFDPAATDPNSFWMPSIMVSGQGHAALGYSHAGNLARPNAGTVGRLAGDPAGAMQTPLLYTSSNSDYNPSDIGGARGRRWGDYSYTSLDPLDDMTLWTIEEYCDTTNSYGVRIAKLVAPPPATPATIADVTAGQNPVNLTLTGTASAGSGFYDPGTNLPGVPAFQHVAVAVTAAGVTGTPPAVVSATWVNPTTLSLVLDATGATASLPGEKYTVQVTNPDGQMASAAILRVTGGTPAVSVGPVAASEGNSGLTPFVFPVTLSTPAASTVTVTVQTSDGTATSGSGDYQSRSHVVAFAPGVTALNDTVYVQGDVCGEADEAFTVTLSGPSGATLGTAAATDSIRNDDDAVAPVVAVTAPNGGEVASVGGTTNIQWTATDAGGVTGVTIALSRDGGASWIETLASGIANTGSFDWNVTAPATTQALVRVTAADGGCNTGTDASDAVFQISDPTAVDDSPVSEFGLGWVRPVPSAGNTSIQYLLPRETSVRLLVMDVRGRIVTVLKDGVAPAGRHVATWTGRAGTKPAPAGVYFVVYDAGGRRFHRKVVLAR